MQRAVLIGAALLLAAVIGMICWKTAEASAAPTTGEMEETAVVCGGRSLTNTELNYYFWSEYFYLVNGYGENLPASLDPEKPLEEQAYDGERTWQDYVLEQTLATVRSTLTMVFEAEAAGFTLPEDYRRSLDEVLQNFRDYAETSGYVDAAGEPDVQAYLKASYGPAPRWNPLQAIWRIPIWLRPIRTRCSTGRNLQSRRLRSFTICMPGSMRRAASSGMTAA